MRRGRTSKLAFAAALVLSVVVSGCRGKPAYVPPKADKLWAQMNHDERVSHMNDVVLPRMRELFQAYDAEQFAEFNCESCHGSGARDGTYRMPNPELTVLDSSVWFRKHRRETPEANDFMWKQVELEMAQMLGTHRYVFVRQRGFRCRDCHVLKDD